jgi:hypothetical protein
VLAMLFNLLQQRKEIAKLKRDIRVSKHLSDIDNNQNLPIQPT